MKAHFKKDILEASDVAEAIATIQATDSAAEIVALARRHLRTESVVLAAFAALAEFWPGHFPNAPAMRRAIAEAENLRRLEAAPLRLVPVTIGEMEDGATYLTATYGDTTLVGAIIQGVNHDKAAQYATLCRVEVVR